MALARSASVSPVVPVPVWNVTEFPVAGINVTDDVGRVVVGRGSIPEYHAPVLARLFTTTELVPARVPVAAVAVTSLLLEDVTVRAARGPVKVFSDCRSVAIASVAV